MTVLNRLMRIYDRLWDQDDLWPGFMFDARMSVLRLMKGLR